MKSAYEQLYEDREYCFSEIRNARKIMCSNTFTIEQYEGMNKGLALMYLYCPEDIQSLIEATMKEAFLRMTYIK